eukprot:TRINITY_DN125413_c0_g1_i1.p6 TRINITY_DN125413_c0_g1~~TRINITY_DN125413_c0_g1_i1.p6  ORF type:complete len:100 (-),score=12.02 TRINITY_DN125413_c0_g1_i1:86-385(-)
MIIAATAPPIASITNAPIPHTQPGRPPWLLPDAVNPSGERRSLTSVHVTVSPSTLLDPEWLSTVPEKVTDTLKSPMPAMSPTPEELTPGTKSDKADLSR